MKEIRFAKLLLVGCFALYFTIVVLNNTTDYDSNFGFVTNVLGMTDTFNDDHNWRALSSPTVHHIFYALIILTEAVIALFLWMGFFAMLKQRFNAAAFHPAKKRAIIGLTLAFILWFGCFITIGGEWFMMWQSEIWNGNPTAFRNSIVVLLGLLFISQKDG